MDSRKEIKIGAYEIGEIAKTVIDPNSSRAFGIYAFSGDHPGVHLAKSVEEQVFLDTYGNTSDQLNTEYYPYLDRSIFLCVINHSLSLPVASMRIILPSESGTGSKSLDDISAHWGIEPVALKIRQGEKMPLNNFWDIATLSVHRQFQGRAAPGLIAISLYRAYVTASQSCGVDWTIAILDDRLFRFGNWQFGGTWSRFEDLEPKAYLGSEASHPVWCQLSKWQQRLWAYKPDLHESIFSPGGPSPTVEELSIDSFRKQFFSIQKHYPAEGEVINLRELEKDRNSNVEGEKKIARSF
ncbi:MULTISPECIES: hypothetical protein [Acidithrix]|uniref:Uncharacterized protein n=1 Tax=Acidithrix ferrooxidans TaxID=1280514 RepID=A0A0D8HEV5_9ACTN|nr:MULTISPECIES: hypothetical protein [Acidithrix]KJF16453.1 hypothetical protein AXFE_26830 [Acidithrix ferrooxidans]CAG4919540.1 unnamed protein product [Acidithrix sp. C25]